MNQENWQLVRDIFVDALHQPAEGRDEFIARLCKGKKEVRQEVESLLSSFGSAGSFMEQTAVVEVAETFVEGLPRLIAGQNLGHYEIVEQIGTGGMGEIYLANDTKLGRRVAVKVLSGFLSSDKKFVDHLLREAQAAAALDHPNICAIHEIAETEDCSFIVMQYVEGKTLAEKLEKKRLKPETSLDLAIQIADALGEAHSRNIIHCDIKSANIIINSKGQAKVLDFGLAKIVKTESQAEPAEKSGYADGVMGTAPYMSPEQLRGEKLDARTDIFSFGVMLYEMLSGQQPFTRENSPETVSAILSDEPDLTKIPAEFRSITRKSLMKDKTRRYQTAVELAKDLRDLSQNFTFGGPKRPAGVSSITSIAILPFQNGSGDPDLDYISDGLSEGLIDQLSHLPQLKVIARSSSFRYRSENIDLQDVANILGARAILMGSVRGGGDDLTIRVELVDGIENEQLWSNRYNRRAADVLMLRKEIAQSVSEKLNLQLTNVQELRLAKSSTKNPEAYRLYSNGVYYFRNNVGKGSLEKAVEYHNRALELDPDFALPYAAVAKIHLLNDGVNPKEAMEKAIVAVQKALELDDTLADAHLNLAMIKQNEWDWPAAEREFKTAIELNPNLAWAHSMYSLFLSKLGRYEEAISENKQAQILDPLRIGSKVGEGSILLYAGRFDEALQIHQKVVKLEPNDGYAHLWLGYSYVAMGMYPEAIDAYRKGEKILGPATSISIFIGEAYALSGKRDEGLAILKELKTTKEYVSPGELAILYAALDDKDEAFRTLEQGYANHDLQLQHLNGEHGYDSLRGDPRFADLVRRVGLPLVIN